MEAEDKSQHDWFEHAKISRERVQADVSFWITGKSKDEIKFRETLLELRKIVQHSVTTMSSS
ncbi:MAG: hypothetical protein EBY48_11380 [Opitutae bacterium]|nr:hypothetical protein [Opitutae bacterium]